MIIKAPTDLIEGNVLSGEEFDLEAFLRTELLRTTGRKMARFYEQPRSAADVVSCETTFWVVPEPGEGAGP